jgi:hypothetical protein
VAWIVAGRENSALAKYLLAEAIARCAIEPGRLCVHQDRGASMTARGFIALLGSIPVTAAPRVCNDNPFSESQFKTLKYQPDFPGRFRDASLVLGVLAAWEVVRRLAVRLVEESLTVRAHQSETWPVRGALWAAAAEPRLPPANGAHAVWGDPLATVGGTVSEGLPGLAGCAVGSGVGVGAAPTHGGGSTVDGLPTAVFVPYETARRLLQQLTGVERAVGTLWGWVQQVGQRLMVQRWKSLCPWANGGILSIDQRGSETPPRGVKRQ